VPSIERNKELERIEEVVENGKAGLLLRIVPHEELMNKKSAFVEKTQSDHENKGPCPSGQAGCLGVKEQGLLQVEVFEPLISREKMGRVGGDSKNLT